VQSKNGCQSKNGGYFYNNQDESVEARVFHAGMAACETLADAINECMRPSVQALYSDNPFKVDGEGVCGVSMPGRCPGNNLQYETRANNGVVVIWEKFSKMLVSP
jgi:hypothetical protein